MNIPTSLKDQVLNRWQKQGFQLILIMAFLVWTPLLVTETLSIQHSCDPLIQVVNCPPCDSGNKKNDIKSECTQQSDEGGTKGDEGGTKGTDSGGNDPPPPPPPNHNQALNIAIGVGVTAGVVSLTVASAPIWLAVGLAGAATAGTFMIADKVIENLK